MDAQNMSITRNNNTKTNENSQSKKKSEVIQMKKSDEKTVRVSFMLEQSIAEEWKDFNKKCSVQNGYPRTCFAKIYE